MPRVSNIGEVRQDLRCGLTVDETLRHIRQIATHPEAWSTGYIVRILQQLSSNEIDVSLRNQRLFVIGFEQSPTPVETPIIPTAIVQPLRGFTNPVTNNNYVSRRTRIRHGRPQPIVEPTDEPAENENRDTSVFSVNTNNFDTTLTFGVEIECLIPNNLTHTQLARKITFAGVSAESNSYNHDEHDRDRDGVTTRTYWKVTTDGSVVSHLRNYNGSTELVSPILKGLNGLKQIETVCKVLAELNIKVNKSCGFHVHHGCKNITGLNVEDIARNSLVLYHKYQSKFNKMMPQSRRNNQYARSMSASEMRVLRSGNLQCSSTRYKVVNIQSFWRHGTIEFRQHSGTIEASKIINWIKITQAIMIKAKKLVETSIDIWNYQFKNFEIELNFNLEIKSYISARYVKFATNSESVVTAAAA